MNLFLINLYQDYAKDWKSKLNGLILMLSNKLVYQSLNRIS